MRSLVVSEYDKIAALMEDGKALDFLISKHEYGVGDVYTVQVENIMPAIDAVFVKLEDGRMGFLHANDVPGNGNLHDRVYPGQRLLVQIIKEPTGKKGPRVNLSVALPGRYFVLSSDTSGINVSRKIADSQERDRLKSIANLMKPEDLGLVIRTEASGRTQEELEEDFVNLWEKWKNIVDKHERGTRPGLIYKEQDFLYSTLRDFFNSTVDEIIVDTMQGKYRAEEFLKTWTGRDVSVRHLESDNVLYETGLATELKNCLGHRVDLPSGGYIIIQTTEALTAIDINSGRFTSSTTLRETVRRTNMEAAVEIARQMRLRNIGGMIIIDFIDMANRMDRMTVMETLEQALKSDKAKPQVGQFTDLCLVEITRKRSGQALSEIFGKECPHCEGLGFTFNLRGDSSHARRDNNRNDRNRNDRNRNDNNRGERTERNDHNRNDRGERNDRNNNNRNDRNRNRNDRNNNNNRNDRNNNNRFQDKRNINNNIINSNRKDEKDTSEEKNAENLTNSKTFAATHYHDEDNVVNKTTSTNIVQDNTRAELKPVIGNNDAEDKAKVKRVRNSKTLQKLRERQKRLNKDIPNKPDTETTEAKSEA